jgi:hypothetical protein
VNGRLAFYLDGDAVYAQDGRPVGWVNDDYLYAHDEMAMYFGLL